MKNEILKYVSLFLLIVFLVWLVGDLFFNVGPDKNNKYTYEFKAEEPQDSMLSYSLINSYKLNLEFPTCLEGNGLNLWVGGDSSIVSISYTGDFKNFVVKNKLKLSANPSALHFSKVLYFAMGNKVCMLKNGGYTILFEVPDESLITAIARFGDDLVLADAGRKSIFIYDHHGNLQRNITGRDEDKAGFVIPSGYFALRKIDQHSFWVVNPGCHKMVKYNLQGVRLDEWGKAAMDASGFCGICNPNNFWLTRDGRFFTAEKGLTRLKVSDAQGELVSIIAPPSSFEAGTVINGIFSPDDKHIIVIDSRKKSLLAFGKN